MFWNSSLERRGYWLLGLATRNSVAEQVPQSMMVRRREPKAIEAKCGGRGADSGQSVWTAPAPWKAQPTGVSPGDQGTPVAPLQSSSHVS